jgi:transcriptional regulator with XRE-family HTH domain
LPFIKVTLKCKKPKEKLPPPETVGQYIRHKRLEQRFHQWQVANIIGVDKATIFNWENDVSIPAIKHYPAIVRFLGYDPGLLEVRTIPVLLKARRRELGFSQRKLARQLSVDPCTVSNWEQDGIVHQREHRLMLAQFLGLPEEEVMRAMGKRWDAAHR